MKQKKRQHTVPKVYLRNFAIRHKNSDMLYVYDKIERKIYRTSVDNVAVEKDFYTLERAEDKMSWENYYATEVEPKLKTEYDKLIKQACSPLIMDKTQVLTAKDKTNIAPLIIIQLLRGKITRNYLDQISDDIIPELLEELYDKFKNDDEEHNKKLKDYYPDNDLIKLNYALTSTNIARILSYSNLLVNKSWIVLRIEGDAEFVTSDNPVMISDILTNDYTPFKNGLSKDTTVVYYPISSKIMIAIYSRNVYFKVPNTFDLKLLILNNERDMNFINMINTSQIKQSERQSFAKTQTTFNKLFKMENKNGKQ